MVREFPPMRNPPFSPLTRACDPITPCAGQIRCETRCHRQDRIMGLSWGILFGVAIVMIGFAALSFIIAWRQLNKE